MRGVCFCEKAHFSILYTPRWVNRINRPIEPIRLMRQCIARLEGCSVPGGSVAPRRDPTLPFGGME